MSLQAACLVLTGVSDCQPPAADRFTISALNHRIGLQLPADHTLPELTELVVGDVDHQLDLFKRLKTYFAGKHVKPPSWFTVWQTGLEAAAKAKAEEKKKLEAEEVAAKLKAEGIEAPAPAVPTPRTHFEVNDQVTFKMKDGQKVIGVVAQLLTHHVFANINENQGVHSGKNIRFSRRA